MPALRYLLLAGGLLALLADAARSAEITIYRTYENQPRHMPTYTDRPLGKASLPVTRIDGALARTTPPHASISARHAIFDSIVRRAAQSQGVDASLIKAVIDVESGFHPQAKSPKGAIGLMQLMPATAARYGSYDLAVPEQNIEAGTRHLRDLLALFGGDVRLALAAYNAGEQAVRNHGYRIPPFAETMRYVPMVLERYRQYDGAGRSSAVVSATSLADIKNHAPMPGFLLNSD